uniref:HSF-type DNA-binding domain-containing protein n=2 Tax=Ditylum brightwellii TaxID=49249 RepID=A0A7S4VFJ7_9STRA|mmetsp:Transcript_19839/g.26365  ORF Transcript_19839/g.26365 Transcript_19839/m.26365 type:complete len:289 (-) Transcript_19839:230-1096(-)
MEALTCHEAESMVTWLPDKEAFEIINPTEFSFKILPKFFRYIQFDSFARRLHRWGFRKVNKGPDGGAFYHPLFRRDNPGLCIHMRCEKKKKRRTAGKPGAAQRNSNSCVQNKVDEPQAKDLFSNHDKVSRDDYKATEKEIQTKMNDKVITPIQHIQVSTAYNSSPRRWSGTVPIDLNSCPLPLNSSLLPPNITSLFFGREVEHSLKSKSCLCHQIERSIDQDLEQVYNSVIKNLPLMRGMCMKKGEPDEMLAVVQIQHRQLMKNTQQSRAKLQESGILINRHHVEMLF